MKTHQILIALSLLFIVSLWNCSKDSTTLHHIQSFSPPPGGNGNGNGNGGGNGGGNGEENTSLFAVVYSGA